MHVAHIFFYSIFLYQFVFASLFYKNSAFYILSPYSLSILIIFLFFLRERTDPIFRNYYLIFYFLFIIISIIVIKFLLSESTSIFNEVKKFQFTFGILLFIPGLLILKDILSIDNLKKKITYNSFLKSVIIFVSLITIYEFISVAILNFNSSSMFYINETFIEINSKNTQGPFGYRPFGFMFYPQPNGILIAFLTSLYLLSLKKINTTVILGIIALLMSQSYSGMIFFILIFVIMSKFRTRKIILLISAILLILILFLYNDTDFFYKFSPKYFESLLFREGQLLTYLVSIYNLNIHELIFGITNSQYQMSHEWFYFSVVREYGFVGLVIFFIIFCKIIYHSLPIQISKNNKLIFLSLFLIVNAHYPAICFIAFQSLLVLIYSINSPKIKKL